jgi:membrane fusion protein (multidrug efflux system)
MSKHFAQDLPAATTAVMTATQGPIFGAALGQKATVVLDMYPDVTWDAEVESISPATGAEFAILPPQNASGNWVKVVQRLPVRLRLTDRPDAPPLRAGMTAYVSIDTGRARSLSGIFGSAPAAAAKP